MAAAVLWAVPRPERPREAAADFICERVEGLWAAVEALHADG